MVTEGCGKAETLDVREASRPLQVASSWQPGCSLYDSPTCCEELGHTALFVMACMSGITSTGTEAHICVKFLTKKPANKITLTQLQEFLFAKGVAGGKWGYEAGMARKY